MLPRTLVLIPALCAAVLAAEPPSLELGYRQMYNLEFPEAHATFHEWERLHPADSMTACTSCKRSSSSTISTSSPITN
jgi:hypothetical protein